MRKFVWDTSALINIKELDASGYSPGHSLMRDLFDGHITGAYENIFPAIAVFEVNATVSRMHHEGRGILREYYIMNENSRICSIDEALIHKCNDLIALDGFSKLRGADLIFACIAYLQNAFLVTKDKDFLTVGGHVEIIDLNESIHLPQYRDQLSGT